MKPAARWLIAAALVLSLGCVKQPDWIESTLVTADVTGVWEGTVSGAAALLNMRVLLDLEQEGPKVQGELQMGFAQGQNSGRLEGRVGGDVFHFRVIAGHGQTMPGEMTVSGDEMQGTVTVNTGAGPQTARILLHRVALPSRPMTERP